MKIWFLILGGICAQIGLARDTSILGGPLKSTYQDMFQVYRASRLTRDEVNTQKLKIVTLNFGLLSEWMAKVPEYPARRDQLRAQLKKYLIDEKPDVFFGQEIWYATDLDFFYDAIADVHALSGGTLTYLPAFQRSRREEIEKRGLFFLVKGQILRDPTKFTEANFTDYRDDKKELIVYSGEALGKLPYHRGFLSTIITLNNGARVLIGTTHLTPVIFYAGEDPGQIHVRAAQSRALAKMVLAKKEAADFAVVGGDWNAAPEKGIALNYPELWDANVEPYVTFFENSQMVDTFRVANPESAGLTWNSKENPVTFYGPLKTPAQRIDFIWTAAMRGAFKYDVKSSRIVFNRGLRRTSEPFEDLTMHLPEPLKNDEGYTDGQVPEPLKKAALFLSDHFGVESIVEFSGAGLQLTRDRKLGPLVVE